MSDRRTQRHIRDLQRRLAKARDSLAVLEEQLAVWEDSAEEMRIRAMVSETPQITAEYNELLKHVVAAREETGRRRSEVAALLTQRDDVLRDWNPRTENG